MTALAAPIATGGADLGWFGVIAGVLVACAVLFILLCITEIERHQ